MKATEQQIAHAQRAVREWCKERGITISAQRESLWANFLGELNEYKEALEANNETEMIDALCDMLVFIFGAYHYEPSLPNLDIELSFEFLNSKDAYYSRWFKHHIEGRDEKHISLISALCIRRIESLGYKFSVAMDETIKEISSRKGYNDGTRWVKDKSEEAKKLWYKADYTKAKESR